MKILKKIILVLGILVLAFIAVSFFLPKEGRVERQLEMNSSSEEVFEQVNDFKRWDNWSPWHKLDPNMQKIWGEKTSGAGATYQWKSEQSNVGNGSMQITLSQPYERIETRMEFEGQGGADGWYTFEDTKNGVLVTWGMKTTAKTFDPFGRLFNVLLDGMVGPDFEKGLDNLKREVEQ